MAEHSPTPACQIAVEMNVGKVRRMQRVIRPLTEKNDGMGKGYCGQLPTLQLCARLIRVDPSRGSGRALRLIRIACGLRLQLLLHGISCSSVD